MSRHWRDALVWIVAFAVVAVLVGAGSTGALDRAILTAAQSIASRGLDVAASLFTILGQTEVTGVIALGVAVVWARRQGASGLTPLLLFVGVGIEFLLKRVLQHPGPPDELHRNIAFLPFLESPSPYSFPSGHTLRTAFLGALVAWRAPGWRWLMWIVVVVMGLTRIYLAEHWTSDVLGGLFLGLALAAAAEAIAGRSRP